MPTLTSAQRNFLRGLAHHRDPVVLVGKQGVSDMLVKAVVAALEAHELIKVRFNEFKEEKRKLTDEIARRTGCEAVGLIGHVAILYRPHPDKEKRKIELP